MPELTPVDYDPFAAEQLGNQWLGNVVGDVAKSIWDLPREALESSEQLRTTGDFNPAPIINAAGLAITGGMSGVPAEAGEAILGAGPIRAYHGSPYDFDKFELSKIGTGEGAQSYGRGLYFAENPATAKAYQTQLGTDLDAYNVNGTIVERPSPEFAAASLVYKLQEAPSTIASRLPVDDPNYSEVRNVLLQWGQSAPPITPGRGKMYQVSINADPEHFLDWDKPLSEQSPKVRETLLKLGIKKESLPYQELNNNPHLRRKMTVDETRGIYPEGVSPTVGPETTLKELGIPGIKYLDQGSRVQDLPRRTPTGWQVAWNTPKAKTFTNSEFGGEQGAYDAAMQHVKKLQNEATHNYVVFDDKLVDIIKKYGLAGLVAGGAHQFTTRPVDHDPFE